MKMKILLFVFLCLSTFSLFSQSKMAECNNIISENSVIQNLDICISNPGWDGIMHITLNGQEICNRQLSGGCLLLKEATHSHFVATKDVRPGDKLLIWATIVGIGKTNNVVEVIVPEVTNLSNPILMISGDDRYFVSAYFSN